MRYHFFLHYGWFFQNLGKEGQRTFMHTTVSYLELELELELLELLELDEEDPEYAAPVGLTGLIRTV